MMNWKMRSVLVSSKEGGIQQPTPTWGRDTQLRSTAPHPSLAGEPLRFDDRLVVPLDGDVDGERRDVISKCIHCGVHAETCYNCANMKCNEVFVGCERCVIKFRACCSVDCAKSEHNFFKQRNPRQVNVNKMIGRGDHYRDIVKNHFSKN